MFQRKKELSLVELDLAYGKEVLTDEEYFQMFIDSRILLGVRESTLQKYRTFKNVVDRDRAILGIKHELYVFDKDDTKAIWMYWINEDLSISTINGRLSNLKCYLNYMHEEGYIEQDVAKYVKKMRDREKVRPILDKKEIGKISNYYKKQKTFAAYRDSVIFFLMLTTGVRVSECLNIQLADMNNQYIVVVETKNLTQRIVYLTEGMQEMLRKYLKVRGNVECSSLFVTIYGKQLGVRTYQETFKEAIESVGIKKHITCHSLRRTYAANAIMQGMDAFSLAALLGHSDIQVTKRYAQIYGSNLQTQSKKQVDFTKFF